MSTSTLLHIPLGAPGIYQMREEPVRALTGVRMDVCAFLGVAPRGPVREPVADEVWPADRPWVEPGRPRRRTVPTAVESFDEYRRVFGGFEGPGLLPYAVASFFEQGGKRAYVARIVHDYLNSSDNLLRTASGAAGGCSTGSGQPILLKARHEGTWGNSLSAVMSFKRTPLSFDSATVSAITFTVPGSNLYAARFECTMPDGSRELRTVISFDCVGHPTQPQYSWVATLDSPLSAAPVIIDVLEGTLTATNGDDITETLEHIGLSAQHPRWLGTVISAESQFVFPDASWADDEISPDPSRAPVIFQGGLDAYEQITPNDFFDDDWVFGDDQPGQGIYCITGLDDLSLVVAPDLYSPFPLAPIESVIDPPSLAGPDFAPCVKAAPPGEQAQLVADLTGLRLDPRDPAELAQILALQRRLEDFANRMRSFIVLIDVPPGLSQRQMLRWRAPFSSPFIACYHSWLEVVRTDDLRNTLIRIPPSSTAAGLIAQSEIQFGVPRGPANLLAAQIVNVSDPVTPSRHDELHPAGINVYLRDRDGVRLTAARTLSTDPSFRQLSVRRMLTMVCRTLDQQTQWMVFETNNSTLRSEMRSLLTAFLRDLARAGAFRGATEAEQFFVRCDDQLNTAWDLDNGRITAEVGLALAEPVEFIIVRFSRDADGTFTSEVSQRGQ